VVRGRARDRVRVYPARRAERGQLLCQVGGEQLVKRHPHVQVLGEMIERRVDGAGSGFGRVDLEIGVGHRQLRAVEQEHPASSVPPGGLDAQAVGAAHRDDAGLAELDLLAARLRDVPVGVDRGLESRGFGQGVRHRSEPGRGALVATCILRGGRQQRRPQRAAQRHEHRRQDEKTGSCHAASSVRGVIIIPPPSAEPQRVRSRRAGSYSRHAISRRTGAAGMPDPAP
jgi:hypothetical protein